MTEQSDNMAPHPPVTPLRTYGDYRRRYGRYGSRRRRRPSSWVMSLNLTPMIDTVFNLLFLFMAISRFGAIEGLLRSDLPVKGQAAAHVAAASVPRAPIRIRLVADPAAERGCRVTIDKLAETGVSPSSLVGHLRKIRNEIPGYDEGTPVYLVAGDDVPWDDVINAYNAAMAAEFQKIMFAGAAR
ncbi:MAG TPA: biopolymer transporter ExbD [Phycisphaerae bacterium]|nr:biopolymer transporter ExbD [Phycisphaerae bacterium]